MTLPLPQLDDRRHADLVEEALARIPRFTPEWTNHNASDPGRALIEVNAWLVETLLYRINRVPEQSYLAFLNLLGLQARPAQAAVAELAFALKPLDKPGDPLTVPIPAATRIAVDDPTLPAEVVFETGAPGTALNAAVALMLTEGTDGVLTPATSFDSDNGRVTWLHDVAPFGVPEVAGRRFWVALVLRPRIKSSDESYAEDRMPAGLFDLFAEAPAPPEGAARLTGPVTAAAAPAAPVMWEVFAGADSSGFSFGGAAGWRPLALIADGSDGLMRSGHLAFDMPATTTPVRFDAIPAAEWAALDLIRPPADAEELLTALRDPEDGLGDDLKAALDEAAWAAMGITPGDFNAVLSVCVDGAGVADAIEEAGLAPDPARLTAARWAEILPAHFAAPDAPLALTASGDPVHRRLWWLRATLRHAGPVPRQIAALHLNTVRAVAASGRSDERLGVSDGRPGQVYRLEKTPVFHDPLTRLPDLTVEVIPPSGAEVWTRVDHLAGQGAAAQVYTLDPGTGEVRFGDGRPQGQGGAIPPAGATIRARSYRFGGGAIGNVGPGAVSRVKGAIPGVAGVSNRVAASGGADAEVLAQVMARAPATLRAQDRAVTGQDFADLARQTPGATIHRAYAIPATGVTATGLAPRPGAVTLVVLPVQPGPRPLPTDADLTAVTRWIDPRRPLATELFVTGPRYLTLTRVAARLDVAARSEPQAVARAAREALTTFLHPVTGGADSLGWPFGQDIDHADLYAVLRAVPGITRVSQLTVEAGPPPPGPCADVLPLPPGHLPALDPGAIAFEVHHAPA